MKNLHESGAIAPTNRQVARFRLFPSQKLKAFPTEGALGHRQADHVALFTARYGTDAHTTQYLADDGPVGTHRLKKEALKHGVTPVMALQLIDCDCPKAHQTREGRASAEWRSAFDERIARLRAEVPGIVAYHTHRGARLVGWLPAPVVIDGDAAETRWKCLVARRLAWLARRYDLLGDAACVEWGRFFRLPHGTREGEREPAEHPVIGSWETLGAWPELRDDDLAADIAELDARGWKTLRKHVAVAAPATPRAPRVRAVAAPLITADLGAISALARAVSVALAAIPRGFGDRHYSLLAVVGALHDAGWTEAAIRRVMGEVAASLGDAHEEIADAIPSTLGLAAGQRPYIARAWLREHQPAVADALAPAYATGSERARRYLDRHHPPHEVTPDSALATLATLLDEARDRRSIHVFAATAGVGKSHTTCETAREHAASGRRTAILAQTHGIALELVARLKRWGVPVAYLAGVLTHRNEDDTFVCRYGDDAERLAAAGVATVANLCDGISYAQDSDQRTPSQQGELALPTSPRRSLPVIAEGIDAPCPERETCSAYAARAQQLAELGDALVLITVHAYAETAHGWLAGHEGSLVVIDEAPELLTHAALTAEAMRDAATRISRASVVGHGERWRSEMLTALAAGMGAAPLGASVTETIKAGLAVLATGSLVQDNAAQNAERVAEWATKSAYTARGQRELGVGVTDPERRRTHTPRPSRRVIDAARGRGTLADADVEALRVAGLVGRALAAEARLAPRCTATVEVRAHGEGAGARELRLAAVVEALAGVLSDTTMGRVVLDATADARALAAVISAPVETSRIAVRDGAPVERVFVPWSHASRRACLRDGAPVWAELRGPLREALLLAAEPVPRGGRVLVVTWRAVADACRRGDADPAVREVLAQLAARGVTVEWAHYGATRGIDRWRDAAAVLALGSPWPDATAVAQQCLAVGLQGASRDVGVHMARAELAQVIGRLRAPRREAPARVVVAASLLPLGADARWDVQALVRGPAPAAQGVEGLTNAAAALAAGVSVRTIQRQRQREADGGVTGSVARKESFPITQSVTPPSGNTNASKMAETGVPAPAPRAPLTRASLAGAPRALSAPPTGVGQMVGGGPPREARARRWARREGGDSG